MCKRKRAIEDCERESVCVREKKKERERKLRSNQSILFSPFYTMWIIHDIRNEKTYLEDQFLLLSKISSTTLLNKTFFGKISSTPLKKTYQKETIIMIYSYKGPPY